MIELQWWQGVFVGGCLVAAAGVIQWQQLRYERLLQAFRRKDIGLPYDEPEDKP